MNECYGRNFILNGEIQPSEIFNNSLVYEGDSIYEVIRMVKGNPVFFHDHMMRLASSVNHHNKKPLASVDELRKSIIILTRSDKKKEANLKIVFNYNNDSENWLVYFLEPFYPSAAQYKKGVRGILFSAERKNPESKVINHKLRTSVANKLLHDKAYEALLVNDGNLVTEGSKSNIFFLKNDTLVTAPDELVLGGITRKHVLGICREHKINVEFKCVKADEISDYDAVFMTGTSPMVLPFCCIDDIQFNSKLPLMEKLRKYYMKKAEESITLFRAE
jgi:branched-chain amino acid aminotransferase